MAVTEVKEIAARQGGLDPLWARSYVRVFRVKVDTKDDGPAVAATATGIPRKNDPYVFGNEEDEQAVVIEIRVDTDAEDGLNYLVTVIYGVIDTLRVVSNPLEVPIEASWSAAQWEEICDEDIHGLAIVNTAGDYFDPPITRDQSRPVLTIVRNEYDPWDHSLIPRYKDHLNAQVFWGYAPGCAKCQNVGATLQFHQEIGYYWRVAYEFHFEPRGWAKRILNQGLRKLDTSTPPSRRQILIDGAPISSPQLLGLNGQTIKPSDSPVFLTFEVYEPADFAALQLDPTTYNF